MIRLASLLTIVCALTAVCLILAVWLFQPAGSPALWISAASGGALVALFLASVSAHLAEHWPA